MNQLFIGDNLTVMAALPSASIDHILTDPPYCTQGKKLTYADSWSEEEWIDFMRLRLIECHRLLKETGTLLIHIDERMHIELSSLLYQIFGKKNHITTFIWKKRASGSAQSKFATTEHEYIIATAKNIKKCKWNGIPQFEQQDKNLNFDALPNSTGNGPNTTYPLYHDADPNDITTEFKIVGNQETSHRKSMEYPLYVNGTTYPKQDEVDQYTEKQQFDLTNGMKGSNYPLYVDDGTQLAQRLDKVSKTERNPETRPNAAFPLYYQTLPSGYKEPVFSDEVGEYKEQRSFAILGTHGDERETQSYPLHYGKQDAVDVYAESEYSQHGSSREKGNDNNKYPLHVGKFEGNKPHFSIEKDNELNDEFYNYPLLATGDQARSRPKSNDNYPIYTGAEGYRNCEDGEDFKVQPLRLGRGQVNENIGTLEEQTYPLHSSQTKISLSPFPGSTEIWPMNGTERGCWRCIPATCQKLIDANMLVVKNNKIYQKQYAHFAFDRKTGKLVPHVRTTPIRTILQGDKYPTNLASNKEIKAVFGKSAFTYAKPSKLIENLLLVISNPNDTILDPFAGSGTTGIAAHRINRQFILIQKDEGNIKDLIQKRLDNDLISYEITE
jgi:DNA modification methylase